MSLPKKGSRKIDIESGSYRWLIRKKPTYSQSVGWQTMIVAIESVEAEAKGLLVINTSVLRPDTLLKSGQTSITPATVRKMIIAAIADGWDAKSSGTYHFDYELKVD